MKQSNHYNISTQGFNYTKQREFDITQITQITPTQTQTPTPSKIIDPATPQRPAQPVLIYQLNKMNMKNKKVSKFQRD